MLLTSKNFPQVTKIPERLYFNQFDWEVTTSLSLGLSKSTYDINPEPDYGYYNSSNENSFFSESSLYIGFYILDGFSVEPEINFNFLTDNSSLSIIGNVSYTFSFPRKKNFLFIKIGYGKSGFSPSDYYSYNYEDEGLFESLDAGVFNASLGMKLVSSSTNAIRIELNYKRFNNSETFHDPYLLNQSQIDISTDAISLVFGYAFLF
jgi:hypothetical protein